MAANEVVERIATEFNTVRSEIDALTTIATSTSNVLLNQSSLEIANTAVTKNFASKTYTGTGASQDVVTNISSVDFTVSSNGSGYWHDRATGDCTVKNDAGTVIDSGSCVVNVSKVHIKSRSNVTSHETVDGIRGQGQYISTNSTVAEAFYDGLVTFNNTGFTLESSTIHTNENTYTYIAYQTLYTHISWGTTNQGKKYIEAYNPITRETMIMYEGSGNVGHEIPHSLGVKLDFTVIKGLDSATTWQALMIGKYGYLDTDVAFNDSGIVFTNDGVNISNSAVNNTTDESYILYGKAKSETWTIVPYTGTGASGNFIETVDVNGVARKPRRVVIKATSIAGDWHVFDSERAEDARIKINTSDAETTADYTDGFNSNGFTLTSNGGANEADVQFIALVEFDTNSDGGDSYFPLPTDDSNLNVTAGNFTFTDGLDANGFVRSSESITGSIDFTGCSDGLKWVYKVKGGDYGFLDVKPSFSGEDNGDNYYFNTEDGLMYDITDTELTTPISFLPNPILVASETPMDIREDDELLTNVMDSLEVSGNVKMDTLNIKNLPTADPLIVGELWNDSNTIKVSTGA